MEWMFGPQVRDGFDIVIGNPPYGISFTDSERRDMAKRYAESKKIDDSYCFFIQRSIDLLQKDAHIIFIVPNTFCDLETGDVFRSFLLNNHKILQIYESGWAFNSAVVDTIVFLIKKERPANDDTISVIIGDTRNSRNASDFRSNHLLKIDYRNTEANKLKKIRDISQLLEELVDVKAGVIMYEKGKGNPPQDEAIFANRPYSTKGLAPNGWRALYRGGDIDRYTLAKPKEFVNYGSWLAAPRDPNIFQSPKIIMRRTDDRLRCTLELNSCICVKSCHIIKIKSSKKISYPFLLGLLNSRLMQYIYEMSNPQMINKVFAEIKVVYVERLPIVVGDAQQQAVITSLVNQILAIKNDNPAVDTKMLEAQIDAHVYRLYGLTDEEIAVVEESVRR